MELFNSICKALNVDETFFVQFGFVVGTWIVLKFLFLDKLKSVLMTREEKTTSLEKSAEGTFEKVTVLSNKYNQKIEDAFSKAQDNLLQKKDIVVKREDSKFKEAEEEATKLGEREVETFQVELQKKEKDVLSQVDNLASGLVSKLTR